jgi:phage tail sheath protein FI
MPTYKTPGVKIEEISKFPPSVAAVETAIPVFIGFTEKAEDGNGDSLKDVPKRITSLLEFIEFFGEAKVHEFKINVEQTMIDATKTITETKLKIEGGKPTEPEFFLFYSMQLFFANGGGPCWILSVGDLETAPDTSLIANAIPILEAYDEPTLLVFPDACLGTNTNMGDVVDAALTHCNKMQDRFTIVDVRKAVPSETDENGNGDNGTVDNETVNSNFRNEIASDLGMVKYGAAYFPYIRTSLPFRSEDNEIKVLSHTVNTIAANGESTEGAGSIAAGTPIDQIIIVEDLETDIPETAIYDAIKQLVNNTYVTIPPSGAIAGVYARVDRRGVWKAPANVSLLKVNEPAIKVTDDLNGNLNIDATSGKSVNVIRSFAGKGTLVWGARTLAGNDNENRYVSVRRFLIFAEESIKKATAFFVFEPNDANTWTKVRSMIGNFLFNQWRDGALAGANPEDAFYVAIGLNKTMTAQDILDGYMIVEIGLAIVRPAEFIVLRFAQMMQKS